MNLELPKTAAAFVEEQVRSGAFATPEEVVVAALESLRVDKTFGNFAPGELDDFLQEGERAGEECGWYESEAARRELEVRLQKLRDARK